MKKKLSSKFWLALTLFSLLGQIAWVVENMYLNVFMYKMFNASAGDIAAKFDVTGASISRHLSVLREADLIRDTREGKFIFYELNASVLEEILLWIAELKGENDA